MHVADRVAESLGEFQGEIAEAAESDAPAETQDRRFTGFAFPREPRQRGAGSFLGMREDPLPDARLGAAQFGQDVVNFVEHVVKLQN